MNKYLLAPLFVALACSACGKSRDGTYASDCVTPGSAGTKATIALLGDSWTLTGFIYSDAACTTKTLAITQTATIKVGDAIDGIDGAEQIDATIQSTTLTPESDAIAASMNSGSYCGITDWKTGVARDVAGKTCGSSVMGNIGKVSYQIWKIDDDSDPMTLLLGEESSEKDGSSPDKRPTTLNSAKPHKRI